MQDYPDLPHASVNRAQPIAIDVSSLGRFGRWLGGNSSAMEIQFKRSTLCPSSGDIGRGGVHFPFIAAVYRIDFQI